MGAIDILLFSATLEWNPRCGIFAPDRRELIQFIVKKKKNSNHVWVWSFQMFKLLWSGIWETLRYLASLCSRLGESRLPCDRGMIPWLCTDDVIE